MAGVPVTPTAAATSAAAGSGCSRIVAGCFFAGRAGTLGRGGGMGFAATGGAGSVGGAVSMGAPVVGRCL